MQAALEFNCGVLGTLTACDAGTNVYPEEGLEIYGTKGRLKCPDPNSFGGPLKLCVTGSNDYVEIPLLYGYSGLDPYPGSEKDWEVFDRVWERSRRGVGVMDMAWALNNGRPQRLSNEMGLHTIEVIHGVVEGTKTGKYYEMTTPLKRMPALRPVYIGRDQETVFDDTFDADFCAEPDWWGK